MIGKHALHLLVVGEMLKNVSLLGSLQIPVALVTVQMTMSDGVVLEGTVREGTNNHEALLSCFLGL